MSVEKGKGTSYFPKNVCYRAGSSNEKGTGQAWHRRQSAGATPRGDGNGFTGCTALLNFLFCSLTLCRRTLNISANDTAQNLAAKL